MRCPLAVYRNAGDSPIDLRIGELPGEPPYVYQAEPGGTVEGPANYERLFVSAGFVLEKRIGDGELKAPTADRLPKVPAKAAKAEAQAKGPGVVIGGPPSVAAAEDQGPKGQKRSRAG